MCCINMSFKFTIQTCHIILRLKDSAFLESWILYFFLVWLFLSSFSPSTHYLSTWPLYIVLYSQSPKVHNLSFFPLFPISLFPNLSHFLCEKNCPLSLRRSSHNSFSCIWKCSNNLWGQLRGIVGFWSQQQNESTKDGERGVSLPPSFPPTF